MKDQETLLKMTKDELVKHISQLNLTIEAERDRAGELNSELREFKQLSHDKGVEAARFRHACELAAEIANAYLAITYPEFDMLHNHVNHRAFSEGETVPQPSAESRMLIHITTVLKG